MPGLENNIKRINEKLQQLLKNYQQLQKDNLRQSAMIEEMRKEKEKNSREMHSLKEQVGILKAATGQMNEADKKAFEKNINHYIREIDKCIGILSE